MSGKTSLIAVAVHAVVFYLLLKYRNSIPLLNQVEGFQAKQETVYKRPEGLHKQCWKAFSKTQEKCPGNLECTLGKTGGYCIIKKGDPCDSDRDCSTQFCSSNKRCDIKPPTPLPKVNELCVNGKCEDGLACTRGRCKIPIGSVCKDDTECAQYDVIMACRAKPGETEKRCIVSTR
jgi:hypothetical protein